MGAIKKDGLRRKIVLRRLEKEMNNLKLSGSWRTTGSGVGAIFVLLGTAIGALVDNDPTTNINLGVLIPALMLAFGNIMSRDNKVSSEDAGIKNKEGK